MASLIPWALSLTGCLCAQKPPEHVLPVLLQPQQQGLWCWAACGQMIMAFHAQQVTQCEQANILFSHGDCCPPGVEIRPDLPLPRGCNNGGNPPLGYYQFSSATNTGRGLAWETIRKEIYCKKLPFLWTWQLEGGGQHMVVVTGYTSVNGDKYVLIADPTHNPAPGDHDRRGDFAEIPFDIYRDGVPDQMSHAFDIYDIRKSR